jgi:phospholipid-binding lipoprotein MlaA
MSHRTNHHPLLLNPRRLKQARQWLPAAVLMLASAHAAAQSAPPAAEPSPKVNAPYVNPKDPFESFNRKVAGFNDVVDENVLKPVATAYVKVVPSVVRTGFRNVLGNFGDVWSAANHFLQGKVQTGLEMGMRVAVNSVLGLGGILDVATEAGLERRDEDFGQTLGRWGVPAGPYLVLPLLGPSSVRETAALPVDRSWSPSLAINDTGTVLGLTGLQVIEVRAGLLGASRLLDDVALDKYSFLRDAYIARRRSLVYDGDPPPEVDPDDEKPVKPAPVKSSSAAPEAATSDKMAQNKANPELTSSASTVTASGSVVAQSPAALAVTTTTTAATKPDTPARPVLPNADNVGGP